jgi:hypothetical protein
MRLCTVQTIFVPNDAMLQRQLRSLRSQRALTSVDRYYAGWCSDEAYWDAIDAEMQALQPRVVRRQTRNWGKARNVNELVSELDAAAYDAMLTMDSDIVFRDDVCYEHELGKLYRELPNMGVLALQQQEGCCHLLANLTRQREVAGGCLLVDLAFWRRIGGYRVMGIYAGDDGCLFQDAKRQGAFFALVASLPVIHPPDQNMAYAHWKLHMCVRDTTGRACTESELQDRSAEADAFWEQDG